MKSLGQPVLDQHRREERELLSRLKAEAQPSWREATRDLITLEPVPDDEDD